MTSRYAIRPALLAALLVAALPCAARAQQPNAPVVRAVIHPDRALLTRALEVSCGETPIQAVFTGLPWGLDETTLKAAASGSQARVEGLSLYERILDEERDGQLAALDAEIEALLDRIREQGMTRERAEAKRAQAESLRASLPPFLAREAAADRKPAMAAWATALDTTRKTVEEADAARRAADVALRELGRQLEDAQRRHGQLAQGEPTRTLEAEVLVRCASKGSARVELSYMAGGVSWAPVYEARADEARKKVQLAVLAQVIQATGEAWKDVKVTLSTAITRRNATPPEPRRLYLGATLQDDRRRVLVRRYEQVSHLDSLDKADAPSAGEGALAAEDQGLSVQLEARRPADFPGDGRPMRLEVETLELPASYSLVIVPKMLPHAFRAAKMKNRARYPLLPGRIDLFSGGSYLGHSMLDRTAQGDEIELAFGIEEPVKVRRVVLDEQQKDPSFLGSTRRLLYAYRIELASFESKPTEVTVQEHVPVSQLDDVKVVLDEKTTSGYELARDDGIVTWKVKLAPKEKKSLELHFRVEIPEKYDSSGL